MYVGVQDRLLQRCEHEPVRGEAEGAGGGAASVLRRGDCTSEKHRCYGGGSAQVFNIQHVQNVFPDSETCCWFGNGNAQMCQHTKTFKKQTSKKQTFHLFQMKFCVFQMFYNEPRQLGKSLLLFEGGLQVSGPVNCSYIFTKWALHSGKCCCWGWNYRHVLPLILCYTMFL